MQFASLSHEFYFLIKFSRLRSSFFVFNELFMLCMSTYVQCVFFFSYFTRSNCTFFDILVEYDAYDWQWKNCKGKTNRVMMTNANKMFKKKKKSNGKTTTLHYFHNISLHYVSFIILHFSSVLSFSYCFLTPDPHHFSFVVCFSTSQFHFEFVFVAFVSATWAKAMKTPHLKIVLIFVFLVEFSKSEYIQIQNKNKQVLNKFSWTLKCITILTNEKTFSISIMTVCCLSHLIVLSLLKYIFSLSFCMFRFFVYILCEHETIITKKNRKNVYIFVCYFFFYFLLFFCFVFYLSHFSPYAFDLHERNQSKEERC